MSDKAIRMFLIVAMVLSFTICIDVQDVNASESSYEGETILYFEVPASHLVYVKGINGRITTHKGVAEYENEVEIKRFTEQIYGFVPDFGYYLSKVLYNGGDVTREVKAGRWIAPKLEDDATLIAEFLPYTDAMKSEANSENVLTPDSKLSEKIGLSGRIVLEGEPVAGALVELQGDLVETKLYTHTDNYGKFDFGIIPKGDYYMYVSHTDSLDGIICFKIVKENIKVLGELKNINGQLIIQPTANTIALYMELALNGDLTITPNVNYVVDNSAEEEITSDLIVKKIITHINNNDINDDYEVIDTNVDHVILKEDGDKQQKNNKTHEDKFAEIISKNIEKNVKNTNFLFILGMFFGIIVLTRFYIFIVNDRKCPMKCENCNRSCCKHNIVENSKV